MSWAAGAVSQERYYDASEVEEYIESVTATIKKLQADVRDQARRADQAEQQLRQACADTVNGFRAFPAGGVSADATVAEAEGRARELIRDGERRAAQLLEGAHAEYQRVVESAQRAALEGSHQRELRLLAAVNGFVQRTQQLRDDLELLEQEASQWRLELAQSTARPEVAPVSYAPAPAISEAGTGGWPAGGYPAAPPGPGPSATRWPTPAQGSIG